MTSALFSGYWIFNNIVQNNEGGLYLNSVPAPNAFSQAVQNFFIANNQPGGAGGNGIYSDQGARNVLIDSNRFTGHSPAASVNFAGLSDQESIVISGNLMETDNSIALTHTTGVTIRDNRMLGTQGSAIFLAGGNNLIDIEGNALENSTGNGIHVNTVFSPTPNTNIRAKNNAVAGNAGAGLRVDAGAYDATAPNRRLDATNNFWGSPTGPVNPANPGGTGNAVVDDNAPSVVEFIPFLTANPIGPTCEQLLAASQAQLAATQAELAAVQAQAAATQAQLSSAQAQLADALAQLAVANAALVQAQLQLDNTLIQFIECQRLLAVAQDQVLESQQALVETQISCHNQLLSAANLIHTAQAQVLECQALLAQK